MMKSPLKLSIFQQFHNRDQPENMLRCICLAPIRNAVNTRVSAGKHVRIELFLSILKSVVSNSIIWFLFIFVNYKMFLKCHSPFRKIHYDPIFCAKTTQFFKKPSKIEGYNADRKRPSCKDGRFLFWQGNRDTNRVNLWR